MPRASSPRIARLALGGALALALAGGSRVARAEGLTPPELERLLQGQRVSRVQRLERGGARYVGGVSYAFLDATQPEVSDLLDDVPSWQRFLPHTRQSRRVGSVDGDTLVEISHGSALLHVGYTLRVHRDGDSMRFWLDRGRPHDIDDAWGFLRAQRGADGRTLLTWGILVDMGPGLLRDLFEARVQALCLAIPERMRDEVIERAGQGAHASR